MMTKNNLNYIKNIALISTILEVLPGIIAFYIVPKATAIGAVLGFCSVIGLFLAAYFFPRHRFLSNARMGSSAYYFWNGQLWKSYLNNLMERGSPIISLISDTWVLIALLGYAFWASNPIIACGILGFASAYSLTLLVQYFEGKSI